MAEVHSNVDEIDELLNRLAAFDFRSRGAAGALGADVAAAAAQGMRDRSIAGAKYGWPRDPTGTDWRANSAAWARRKAARFDAHQPGVMSGQMLSYRAIYGETIINSDSIDMRYGRDELPPPHAYTNGAPLRDYERKVTDRQKADFFAAQGWEFYGLDDQIAADIYDLIDNAFADYVLGLGG